jgi:hypothetical protein
MHKLQNKDVIGGCSEAVDSMWGSSGLKLVQLRGFVGRVYKALVYTSLMHYLSTTLYHYFYSTIKKLISILYTLSTRPIIKTICLNNQLLLSQGDKL